MHERRRLLINWTVQGPLIVRLVTHLVTHCAAMATLIMVCWILQRDMVGTTGDPTNNFWYRFLPLVASAVALLPYVTLDVLRITNRIAGPLYRFEQIMKEFEETGTLPQAKLRENDLLGEFCNRFNRFVEVMHERYPECRSESASPDDTAELPAAKKVTESAAEEPVLV